jgi:hypothetical protein
MAKIISDKEIEKWVNDHLANLSLQKMPNQKIQNLPPARGKENKNRRAINNYQGEINWISKIRSADAQRCIGAMYPRHTLSGRKVSE